MVRVHGSYFGGFDFVMISEKLIAFIWLLSSINDDYDLNLWFEFGFSCFGMVLAENVMS